jgi:hypothetical protein
LNTNSPNLELKIEQLEAENVALREALRLSTNGLRFCSRWNIAEKTEKTLITQVISNEILLKK